MWNHSGASIGGNQLEMFAGCQDLVFKKKRKLEKPINRHCAFLYNWAVRVFFIYLFFLVDGMWGNNTAVQAHVIQSCTWAKKGSEYIKELTEMKTNFLWSFFRQMLCLRAINNYIWEKSIIKNYIHKNTKFQVCIIFLSAHLILFIRIYHICPTECGWKKNVSSNVLAYREL